MIGNAANTALVPISGSPAPAYRFGPYEYVPREGLYRSGVAVPLPPKESLLLQHLLHRRGKLLGHREIEDLLWPRQQVTYASLARTVYSLRRTLGHGRESYVETVPKRGYRMAVPVRVLGSTLIGPVAGKALQTTPTAYAHFQEGVRQARRLAPTYQGRAIALFEKALAEDNDFATAHAAIAECRLYQATRGHLPPADALEQGLRSCDAALQIDPQLASAIAIRAWFAGVMQRQTDVACEMLGKALFIDPTYFHACCYRAWVLRSMGRLKEAVAAARCAFDIDPHSYLSNHVLAWTLFLAGNVSEALEIEHTLRANHGQDDVAPVYIAVFAAHTDQRGECLDACNDAIRVSKEDPPLMSGVAYALARGQRGTSDDTRFAGSPGGRRSSSWRSRSCHRTPAPCQGRELPVVSRGPL